jgi:hypothetical protein
MDRLATAEPDSGVDQSVESMPVYTEAKPPLLEPLDEVRRRIPGWGADLDPADRPSVPRLQASADQHNAHWVMPDQQPELWPRERSIEHGRLTPVFGTSCPPRGVSGAIRRYSYRRFSEARAAHWLLLILADRVDAFGSHVRSFATLRPDNPITQTGVRAEFTHGGLRSRRGRVDVRHHLLDPVIVAGPWVLGGLVALRVVRRFRRLVSG